MYKAFAIIFFIFASLSCFSQTNLIKDIDIDNKAYWDTTNKNTLIEYKNVGKDNSLAIHVITKQHGDGIWQRGLQFNSETKYIVKLDYFIKKGSIAVLLKHGDNSYGLLNNVSINEVNNWKTFETTVSETISGNDGSLWIIGEGDAEFIVDNISVTRVSDSKTYELDQILYSNNIPIAPLNANDNYSFDQNRLNDLKLDFPIVAQEYHGWKHSPLTNKTDIWWFWWGYPERLQEGSYWRRNTRSASYPYIGPYTTEDKRVGKWSQGQAKNCGLQALFFEPYQIYADGTRFANEKGFSDLLDVATDLGYQLAYEDMMAFAPGEIVHKKENIINKNSYMINKYSDKKGFYKINGRPVLMLRFRDGTNPEDISDICRTINKNTNKNVYYILQQPYDVEPYLGIKEISAIQGPYINDLLLIDSDGKTFGTDTLGKYDWKSMDERFKSFSDKVKKSGKDWWPWISPNFDSRSQWTNSIYLYWPGAHFNGDDTNVFTKQMYLANQYKPYAAIITSWNCFGENTPLEAKWDGDGYNGDPFYHQKLIAKWKNIKWQDPPKPDKEIVDPLLWWKVFGIDKNGPIIPKAEIRFGDLIVDVEDNTTVPEKLLVSRNGNAFYKVYEKGHEANGIELLNSENVKLIKKHGIIYIAPKTGTLNFKVDKAIFKDNVNVVFRYDGNADGKQREISYPSIIENYSDPIGDSHEGFLPKFWTIDREEVQSDVPKITIEPLTHLDLNKEFIVSVSMPINLIGFVELDKANKITKYTDIEGLRKRFRVKLDTNMQLNDILIIAGVDGLGNVGFPKIIDVNHLGY